jgi:hypothetical protein
MRRALRNTRALYVSYDSSSEDFVLRAKQLSSSGHREVALDILTTGLTIYSDDNSLTPDLVLHS